MSGGSGDVCVISLRMSKITITNTSSINSIILALEPPDGGLGIKLFGFASLGTNTKPLVSASSAMRKLPRGRESQSGPVQRRLRCLSWSAANTKGSYSTDFRLCEAATTVSMTVLKAVSMTVITTVQVYAATVS